MPQSKINISNDGLIHKRLNGLVTDEVGNYDKHPFFVKKANTSKEKIRKSGLPKFGSKTNS